MSKSLIVQLGSSALSQSELLEQAKKQELDKLNSKIEEMKRHRREHEREIKTLLETKEAIEQSIKNTPQCRTMDELKMELAQKDQTLSSMRCTALDLQDAKENNERLMQRVKINELLLREANESIMKR